MAPAASSTTPERLGRFAILRKIGQGGFGEVWLAEDTLLKRQVALKLPRFAASDTKRHRRFLAESRAVALLRHPHIVPVLDAGVIDGKHFIASEFIRGVPLDDIHEDRPASVRWAAETIAKLARATHVAHQKQIVHRDLKPDNVLIDRHGEPQVLDFGLAKRLDGTPAQTMDGTVMGTPHYMSPEQARGEVSQIGPASDQFSLGVILYRLLVGQTPHSGQPLVVLQKLISNPTPSLADVERVFPADLIAICDKARAGDIRERYSSCEAFADDLQRFLDDLPVQARPPSPLARAIKWGRKYPRETSLAVACVASALLLFTVSIWGWAQAARASEQAANSEQGVRNETTRLVQLEERLSERVAEAAALRDETAAARQATFAARQALEAESETLDQQTRLAEASLAKLRETEAGLSDAEAQRQQVQASLSDVVRAIDGSLSLMRDSKPTADSVANQVPTFTQDELSLLDKQSLDLLCTTGEKAFVVKPTQQLQLQITDQHENSSGNTNPGVIVKSGFLRCIRFDSNNQMYALASIDGKRQIAKMTSDNRWTLVAPFKFESFYGLSQYQREQALEKGIFDLKSEPLSFSICKNDRFYFMVRQQFMVGQDCVRYDPSNGKYKFMFHHENRESDLQAYADDPSAIYLLSNGFVKRYDLQSDTAATTTTVLGVHNETFGDLNYAIRISGQEWLVCFSKKVNEKWIFRQGLIDMVSKTYQFSEVESYGWAVAPSGQLISIDGKFLTFYDLKGKR